jgi:S-adenosylmethionine synthetase
LEHESVRDAECCLVSQIGRPITDPQLVDVRLGAAGPSAQALEREVAAIVRRELDRIPTMWREVLDVGLTVC